MSAPSPSVASSLAPFAAADASLSNPAEAAAASSSLPPSAGSSLIPFQCIDWSGVPRVAYPGTSGCAHWRTVRLGGLRVRLVEYSAGYLADHWCQRGHIVHVLEGMLITEQQQPKSAELTATGAAEAQPLSFDPSAAADPALTRTMHAGQTYVVSDDLSSHRSRTDGAVRLLIIDGEFLASPTLQQAKQ